MNYKYAQIKNNKVLHVVDVDFPIDPNGDYNTEWLEVTNANPQPHRGWRFDRSTGMFYPATEETIVFENAVELARADIDTAAGIARKKSVTDIPGQAEVYREKYEQAIDFLSSPGQVRYSDYPLLEIECKILDIPMKNVAENVIKRRSEWITKMSAIESLRLSGKYNLNDCMTISEVNKLKAHIIHKLSELN